MLNLLENYKALDQNEENSRVEIINFVNKYPDCFENELKAGHITGSALVVDETFNKTLLTHHIILDKWFQFGGHSDGDSNTLAVGLREATEESCLKFLRFLPDHSGIFDADIHPITANSKMPQHNHYDIRILLIADIAEKHTVTHESKDLKWVRLEEVSMYNTPVNEKYIQTLKELTKLVKPDTYVIMGSVALLSYTKKIGYERQIHDIDIIMESREAQRITQKLLNLGYTQNTFINKRMPLYKTLNKLAKDRYLRFSKDGVDIEILSSPIDLIRKDGHVTFELFPHVSVKLPKEVFVISNYGEATFNTVSKEMLYFFKKAASNTIGKRIKYKEVQRLNDLQNLEKLVDIESFSKLKSRCKLGVFGVYFRLPSSVFI